jgi:hypothetical protein
MYCDRVKQKLFPERPKSMERFCKKKNSDRLFIATAVVNQNPETDRWADTAPCHIENHFPYRFVDWTIRI